MAGCLVLAVFALLAIEIVRRSDLPRRLMVEALQKQTGLRVEVGGASVGWSGRSTVRDVTVRLPLDDSTIFKAPVVHVTHSGLLMLLATRDPGVTEVTIERPAIHMVEDANGAWTLVRAVDIVRATWPPAQAGAAPIPRVSVTDGAVHLRRQGHKEITLPLALRITPDGSLVGHVEATLGGAEVAGRVTTATWDQSFDIKAADFDPIIALWLDDVPGGVSIDAHWEGRPRGGAISGDLTLRDLSAGEYGLSGRMAVSTDAGGVVFRASDLAVRSSSLPAGSVEVTDAVVRIEDGAVICERLTAASDGTHANIRGAWRAESSTASVVVDWSGDTQAQHSGHAEIAARLPKVGGPSVSGTFETTGGIGTFSWRTRATIEASGPDWAHLSAGIESPVLSLELDGEPLEFSNLRAGLQLDWPTLTVASLSLPNAATTSGRGAINLDELSWWIDLHLTGVNDTRIASAPATVSAKAKGDARRVQVETLEVSIARGGISLNGDYEPDRQTPLVGRLRIRAVLPDELLVPGAAAAGAKEVSCDMSISGAVEPLLIEASGSLEVPALRIEKGSVGPFQASIDAVGSRESVTARTSPVDVLGGCAAVEATYFSNPSIGVFKIDADGVALGELVALFTPTFPMKGVIDGNLSVHLPGLDPELAEAEGTWMIRDARHDRWSVPQGRGRIAVGDAGVRLHEMALTSGDAEATGEISIADGIARIDMASRQWPVADAGGQFSALLDGDVDLVVDVERSSATGSVKFHADARLAGGVPATIDVAAEVDQRTIRASAVSADLLGGRVHGTAMLPIDEWTRAAGELEIERIDLAHVAAFFPDGAGLAGTANGRVEVGPSNDPKALEPLRVAMDINVAEGSIRKMKFGGVRFVGYAGRDRAVLDRSDILLAGGTINAWSQLSRHDGEPFVHLNLQATDLDLNSIIHSVDPTLEATPGRADLRASVGGYLKAPHRAFGEARAYVRKAELQPIPAFALLYSVLNVRIGKPEPEGAGEALIRLDGDALQVARLQYFNRGTDINGAGRIENLWAGRASPVEGALVASNRPLKGSKLPFGAELDRLLHGVMRDAASVKVGGTLGAPTVKVVPFSDVVSLIQGVFGIFDPEK